VTVLARFDFPAGRYHATPWGRHVNEGAIEWPPSPWRILRALVSVGHQRIGWREPPAEARALIDALASAPPAYVLPPANAAHTRHFMPLFKEKTTRVLDTFAVLDREQPGVVVRWDVELPPNQLELLGALLTALPYLGRAESWTVAGLVDEAPAGPWTVAAARAPNGRMERIDLLAPLSAPHLAEWRTEALTQAKQRKLEQLVAKAEADGKPVPTKLSKKQLEELEAGLPSTVVEALSADTASLQKGGWPLPPGTRWLSYWRPSGALEAGSVRRDARRAERVDGVLYAVASETVAGTVLPPLSGALLRAEQVHATLASRLRHTPEALDTPDASALRTARLQLLGRSDDGPSSGHQHVSILPVSLAAARSGNRRDAEARIDHVLVTLPRGATFDAASLEALRGVRKIYGPDSTPLWLTRIWEGRCEDRADLPWAGKATTWVSHTPFIAPRHLKKSGASSLVGQLRRELGERLRGTTIADVEALLEATSFEVHAEVGGRSEWLDAEAFWSLWSAPSSQRRLALNWRGFRTTRRSRPAIPGQPALGLRITFPEPVHGPLSLGYGSHYGLGALAREGWR